MVLQEFVEDKISEVNSVLEGKAEKDHKHDEYLTEHQDVSHLATKEDVEELRGQIENIESTQYDDSELREMIEAIKVPSIEGLATKEDLDAVRSEIPSIKDLATTAKLTEEIDRVYSEIEEEIERAIASEKEIKSLVASQEKYRISNVPEGTIVDYREKEIRIMCPEDAVFTQQQVGEGGNPNMYYMTFTTYAPEGAVTFKEGDKGVIVDEVLDFEKTAGTGVDEHGRKFKNHWFALANFNGSTWNYFGKTSSTKKYIGWTYVVEWYDAEGNVIDSDCIRINLSNKDCHSALEPSYVNAMKAELEGRLEDLEQMEIPSVEGLATEEFVIEKIAEAQLGQGEVDLSNYATKDDLEEVRGEIPSLTNYATKDYVAREILKSEMNREEVDLTPYATKEFVEEQINGIEIPSTEDFATKDEVQTKVSELTDMLLGNSNRIDTVESSVNELRNSLLTQSNRIDAIERTFVKSMTYKNEDVVFLSGTEEEVFTLDVIDDEEIMEILDFSK